MISDDRFIFISSIVQFLYFSEELCEKIAVFVSSIFFGRSFNQKQDLFSFSSKFVMIFQCQI